METLEDFVSRFSQSVGCCYDMNKIRNLASLKRIDSFYRSRSGKNVFAWVLELKKTNLFRIDTYKKLADNAGVGNLANGEKKRLIWEETGYFFYIMKDSRGDDYQKAVIAMKAINVQSN